ncbi:hypothetical protein G7B40_031470 [Aetokthonos hydrillicola Thurmond2011]|jgi:hypothetical protein|uniref:Uncharacterized protein n=1 Tax=Aetokthonos hydrillicola Thurmond2011 TaxID=2712845 RepID=A0AAP5M8D8_9CYAN|nr:hypothetical protein [Aetokthonos hydrillicola]MBO3462849.1 hypothetical protein [Aetokthonos hydrillicola CCALA 1050]MBW4590984.1 hypothetical protein [Aetokthonos hydrillicola CCALA 1050]MDR9899046.1 hypothetical protein [Aetokthonos hydrillicola Thurmond2011]
MFKTTFVQFSDQEYELRVDTNVAQPTATWLKNQECEFSQLSYDTCTGFKIFGISQVVLQRLSEKFPPIPANDNLVLVSYEERLDSGLKELRKIALTGEWKDILEVTNNWTSNFKKAVWKALAQSDREHIEMLKLKNSIETLEKVQLRKMVTLLKEVTIIHKDFKLANKNEEELLDEMFKLLPQAKREIEAALTLVQAMN